MPNNRIPKKGTKLTVYPKYLENKARFSSRSPRMRRVEEEVIKK